MKKYLEIKIELILTITRVVSFTIDIAVKDIIKNFVTGLLLIDMNITIGDNIEVNGKCFRRY